LADSASEPEHRKRLRALGATLDAGVPDGLMGGIAYRPWSWLRVQAGAGTNSVSAGLRGGVAIVPFGVGPSLTLEVGHYFEGDANGTASRIVGSDYRRTATAEHFGYQYANAHLGLELGHEHFSFFVHGGVSYVHLVLRHANDVLSPQFAGAPNGGTTVNFSGDPVITAWVPSAKLGFLIYLV
jgi:hypothetical protein